MKRVDLTEILIALSGMFLLIGAFDNLSWLTFDGVPGGIIVLGIVSLLVGLLMLMDVLMPSLLKGLGEAKDILVLVLALVFVIWGLVANFADTWEYGASGPTILVGGFSLLIASMLRMGILK